MGTITTDSTGIAKLEGLPLSRYMVKEVATASGYVLDGQERIIDLNYRDAQTAVVTYSEDWQNERQKARIRVVKLDANTETPLPGASFGLYAEEDICSESGAVMIAAGTLIQQLATDSNGELVFEADLPIGFSYSVRELIPPAGYASDPESRTFVFEASAANDAVTDFEYVFMNKPTVVGMVAIITFILCYELISMITNTNNMHEFDTFMFFKYFVKMWIAVYVVSHTSARPGPSWSASRPIFSTISRCWASWPIP